MNKIILMLLLAVVSNSAMAEWTEILKNDEASISIEYSRSKFSIDNSDVWMKFKYSKNQVLPDNRIFNSMAIHISVLCKDNKIMMKYFEQRFNDKYIDSGETRLPRYEETVPASEFDGIAKLICEIGKNKR